MWSYSEMQPRQEPYTGMRDFDPALLGRLNRELEQRVLERTAHLAEANSRLTKQMRNSRGRAA